MRSRWPRRRWRGSCSISPPRMAWSGPFAPPAKCRRPRGRSGQCPSSPTGCGTMMPVTCAGRVPRRRSCGMRSTAFIVLATGWPMPIRGASGTTSTCSPPMPRGGPSSRSSWAVMCVGIGGEASCSSRCTSVGGRRGASSRTSRGSRFASAVAMPMCGLARGASRCFPTDATPSVRWAVSRARGRRFPSTWWCHPRRVWSFPVPRW